jgi:secreted Zn-dependent insulinase-like peptidase
LDIVKTSPNDKNRYRHLLLDNQLKVLLVESDESPKSSAALAVNVGHYDDPNDRPGLAHFLEHMLFLGTKEFPQIGEFQNFISQHGGSNNAWTGPEHTCYFFDISNSHFEQALARFSRFFVSPLFHAEAVEKERMAVDSEFQMKLNDDARRLYEVHKAVVNQQHPFSKFSVGNAQTLRDKPNSPIRDELLEFYQQQYSADLMTLCLVSPHSLDEQQSVVEELFSDVINRNKASKSVTVPFWPPNQAPKWIHIQPIKEMRKLTVAFEFPSMIEHYQTKPLSYIAHMIGYEGGGSVTQWLKHKEWITSLAAGGGASGSNFREFTISCILTPEGLEHCEEIIERLFQYIRLVTQHGLSSWRYDEKRAVMEAAFRFQESTKPMDLASHLVMSLQHYQPDDAVYGDYMMQAYDAELTQQLASTLTPENCRVTLVSQQGEFDQTADWYDTPYSIADISAELIEKWRQAPAHSEMYLADENPYICHHLETQNLESEATLPEQIQNLPGFTLWHLQEPEIRVPKGAIYVAIDSPKSVETPRRIVMLKLCVELFMDALSKRTYQAELAGMSYNIYAHQGGLTLALYGFSEKMPQLLSLILERFKQREFQRSRFDEIKQQLQRFWANSRHDRPISQLFNCLSGLLQPNNPPHKVLLEALNDIQVDELPVFVGELLDTLHVEMFVYGDWQRHQALDMGDALKDALRVKDQEYRESLRPLIMLGNTGSSHREVFCDQPDSAVVVYQQAQTSTPRNVALFTLTNQLMSSEFFHQIRTKQQLGYMVGTGNMPLNRHPGIVFYVQSPTAGSGHLLSAIDEFLNAFYMVLLELTDYQWHSSKRGLLNQIMTPDANLKAKGQRLWVAIGNKDHDFSHRDTVIEEIKQLSRADMIRFVVEQLKPRTATRLVMSTQGTNHKNEPKVQLGQDILSIEQFHALPRNTELG